MNALMAAVMEPLALPWSGSAAHTMAPWALRHARCMVLAWGVLLPLGALVARFFKVLPGQDRPRCRCWVHGRAAARAGLPTPVCAVTTTT